MPHQTEFEANCNLEKKKTPWESCGMVSLILQIVEKKMSGPWGQSKDHKKTDILYSTC